MDQYRKQATAYFEPQKDITVYELALILRIAIGGINHDITDCAFKFPNAENNASFDIFSEIDEIQRHFRIESE